MNLNFLQKQSAAPPVCGRRGSESSIICSIVPSHVNIENVVFYRKKVSYPHGFSAFGQDKSIPSAPVSHISKSSPPCNLLEGRPLADEYGPTFITVTDEDGREIVLEFVDALEYNGQQYQAFFPAETEGEDEDPDNGLVILKVLHEDGEDLLSTLDSDEELDAVYDLFMESLFDEDGES